MQSKSLIISRSRLICEGEGGTVASIASLARTAIMNKLTIEALGRPAQLLLVEDNSGDVMLTRAAFQDAKVANNLSVARDGEQAMRMLRREGPHAGQPTPDLILLDLNLPRMDGREVLQAIRSDPALSRIPVIVLTSSNADMDILKSYDLKANGYIVKPVDFERLQEIVASIESFWFTVVVLPSAVAAEPAVVVAAEPANVA
jgi:two-component system, chemotaxis family, response regulator Rcp1